MESNNTESNCPTCGRPRTTGTELNKAAQIKQGPEAIDELLKQFPAEVEPPTLTIYDRLKRLEVKIEDINSMLASLVNKKRKSRVKVLND